MRACFFANLFSRNGQNYQRKNYQEEIYQRMVVRNSSLMWVQLERCREICVVAD